VIADRHCAPLSVKLVHPLSSRAVRNAVSEKSDLRFAMGSERSDLLRAAYHVHNKAKTPVVMIRYT
jgi:hypothetical protein